MPGFLCTHTHFYSAFARGMAIPGEPPRNFLEILERLWWRLDKLLTLEDTRASAEVFMADAIRHGTTCVVDHHASPNAVDGSLDVIADAVEQAGIRACLAYEVSDRDGQAVIEAGIRENERFIRALRTRTQPTGGGGNACRQLWLARLLYAQSCHARTLCCWWGEPRVLVFISMWRKISRTRTIA